MKKYIYLDWNVIQYIKHGTVNDGFDAVKFKEFLSKLKKYYYFPASEGHLRDLCANFKESNRHYIEKDLEFLAKLSDGHMLDVKLDESLIVVKADITQEFNNILSEEDAPIDLFVIGGQYSIDMNKLSSNDIIHPFLEQNKGVLDSSVMRKMLKMMYEQIDNPDIYKRLRIEISKLKERFKNTDTVVDQNSEYFKGLEQYLEFLEIADDEVLKVRFFEFLASFLSIDGRVLEELSQGELIQNAYIFLDMHPLFRDKINKKNRPDNMYRDVKNLYFASEAKFYVTQDEMTYKKSKFIAKALGLKVRVVKMDELRRRLETLS